MDKQVINTQAIKDFIIENKITKTKFCEMCKISKPTLNKILSGSIDFGIVALFKIARATKKDICYYINK